jgi:adenylate kinase
MIAILLGAPGVGKGTQAQLAAQANGWIHLSTGDLLRQEAAAGSELGLQAKQYMSRGDLVPDQVMVGLVVSRICALKADDVLLLDGFPRTLPQAEELGKAAPSGSIGLALYFSASDDVLTARLLGRGRQDDSLSVIQHRLTVYRETTEPLVAYYRNQNILHEIQADRPVEAIQAETSEIVKSALSQTETA